MTLRLSSVTVGAFQENTYLVVDERTRRAVLVDPGAEPERIVRMVRESGAALDAIWLTHAHVDHIGAIAGVKRVWDVPVHMHPLDRPIYERGETIAQLYGIPFEQPEPPEISIDDGDVLSLGDASFTVVHVPGHAPGHVVYHGEGIVLAGDLLFAGSIGRTDLPFSDGPAMHRSLERIMTLADELVVYPGHGPATTIGDERTTNPFLTGVARPIRR